MRTIRYHFRWEVRPDPDVLNAIEVLIPTGGTTPIINMEFVKQQHLSDREIEASEEAVLRKIAIIE